MRTARLPLHSIGSRILVIARFLAESWRDIACHFRFVASCRLRPAQPPLRFLNRDDRTVPIRAASQKARITMRVANIDRNIPRTMRFAPFIFLVLLICAACPLWASAQFAGSASLNPTIVYVSNGGGNHRGQHRQ